MSDVATRPLIWAEKVWDSMGISPSAQLVGALNGWSRELEYDKVGVLVRDNSEQRP
jgi:hypothetical protein